MDAKRGVEFIGVTVCFIVHDGKGRMLLQKRGKNARDEHGKWDIGGGAVEFGETMLEAVNREIYEEYLTIPIKVEYLSTYEAHRKYEGKPTHWIALLHAAQLDPAKIKIGEPDRIDEVGWFDVNSLPKPLHSQIQKALNIAIKHKIIH